MSHLKKSIAIIAALAGSGFIAPMSSAQDVINIANIKGAQEKAATLLLGCQGWDNCWLSPTPTVKTALGS